MASLAVVDSGVSVEGMVVVEEGRDQEASQVEGHREDLAYGAAEVEGDVRDRNLELELEDNRLDRDQATWVQEVVLVQARILLEVDNLVGGVHQDRVPAHLDHEEGVDRGAEVAVMDQGVADLGGVRKLHRGRGAPQAVVVHQGQA